MLAYINKRKAIKKDYTKHSLFFAGSPAVQDRTAGVLAGAGLFNINFHLAK